MLLMTTSTIEGKSLETLGMVMGSMVQSKNMFKDIGAGFKNIVGGELRSYTKMMQESRDIAIKRMVEQAEKMGADAIVCIRFSSSGIMQGASEVMVSGTAVKFV